jgi:hypothetical protein
MKYPAELIKLITLHSKATEKTPLTMGNVSFWIHKKDLCWNIHTTKWDLETLINGINNYILYNFKNISVTKGEQTKVLENFELFIHHKREGWLCNSAILNKIADFFNNNKA